MNTPWTHENGSICYPKDEADEKALAALGCYPLEPVTNTPEAPVTEEKPKRTRKA